MTNWVDYREVKEKIIIDQMLKHYNIQLQGKGDQVQRGKCGGSNK